MLQCGASRPTLRLTESRIIRCEIFPVSGRGSLVAPLATYRQDMARGLKFEPESTPAWAAVAEARSALSVLIEASPQKFISPYNIAIILEKAVGTTENE